jgi:BON domain
MGFLIGYRAVTRQMRIRSCIRVRVTLRSVIRMPMNIKVEAIRRAKQGLLEDEELQALITERLEEDGSFWVAAGKFRTVINVEVTDGHVTLTGNVRTAMDRRRADLLARALGAAGVENRLRVAEGNPAPKRVA